MCAFPGSGPFRVDYLIRWQPWSPAPSYSPSHFQELSGHAWLWPPGVFPLFLPISLAKGQDRPSSQRTSFSFSGRPLVSLVCFIYLRLCHFLPPVGFGFRLPFLSSFLQVSSRVVDLGPSPMRPLQLSLPAPSARIPQVSAGRVLRPGAFHLLLSPTARLSACGLISAGSVTALGRKGHRDAFLGDWTLLGVWLKWDSLGILRGAS